MTAVRRGLQEVQPRVGVMALLIPTQRLSSEACHSGKYAVAGRNRVNGFPRLTAANWSD